MKRSLLTSTRAEELPQLLPGSAEPGADTALAELESPRHALRAVTAEVEEKERDAVLLREAREGRVEVVEAIVDGVVSG